MFKLYHQIGIFLLITLEKTTFKSIYFPWRILRLFGFIHTVIYLSNYWASRMYSFE